MGWVNLILKRNAQVNITKDSMTSLFNRSATSWMLFMESTSWMVQTCPYDVSGVDHVHSWMLFPWEAQTPASSVPALIGRWPIPGENSASSPRTSGNSHWRSPAGLGENAVIHRWNFVSHWDGMRYPGRGMERHRNWQWTGHFSTIQHLKISKQMLVAWFFHNQKHTGGQKHGFRWIGSSSPDCDWAVICRLNVLSGPTAFYYLGMITTHFRMT